MTGFEVYDVREAIHSCKKMFVDYLAASCMLLNLSIYRAKSILMPTGVGYVGVMKLAVSKPSRKIRSLVKAKVMINRRAKDLMLRSRRFYDHWFV